MTVAFTKHFEDMRFMEQEYLYYKNNPYADFRFPEEGEMVYVKLFKTK